MRFSLDGFCFLFWIFMLLLVPLQWVAGWLLAAVIHELGHLFMLSICGIKIYSIRVGPFGAQIETEAMHPIAEAACAFSGPVMGFLAILLRGILPYAAVSAVVQSAYNMIPAYPLDGGRVIKALLNCFLPSELAVKISLIVSHAVIVCVVLCGLWASCKYHLGIWPILFPAAPILLTLRKNSLHCGKKNSTIQERKF